MLFLLPNHHIKSGTEYFGEWWSFWSGKKVTLTLTSPPLASVAISSLEITAVGVEPERKGSNDDQWTKRGETSTRKKGDTTNVSRRGTASSSRSGGSDHPLPINGSSLSHFPGSMEKVVLASAEQTLVERKQTSSNGVKNLCGVPTRLMWKWLWRLQQTTLLIHISLEKNVMFSWRACDAHHTKSGGCCNWLRWSHIEP